MNHLAHVCPMSAASSLHLTVLDRPRWPSSTPTRICLLLVQFFPSGESLARGADWARWWAVLEMELTACADCLAVPQRLKTWARLDTQLNKKVTVAEERRVVALAVACALGGAEYAVTDLVTLVISFLAFRPGSHLRVSPSV